jgi:flavin-binding protein dodecin
VIAKLLLTIGFSFGGTASLKPDERVKDELFVEDTFERKERDMTESVYKVIELVGTSTESWEKAAAAAVETAAKSLRDLRIAEVVELDMQLEDGKVRTYRAKVKLSFKYESED